MKALLIVDMQTGSFSRATPRYDAEKVVQKINLLSEHFRETNNMVIYIQHDGTKGDVFIPGSQEWQLLPMLVQHPEDLFVNKIANDPFYKSDLDQQLKTLGVDEVYVTGCATDFCVDATVRSALGHDYDVYVVADGHTTADRPELTAKQVINHHNWLWENMIPTEGCVRVIDTAHILADKHK